MATNKPTRAETTALKLRAVRKLIDDRMHDGEIKRRFANQFKCAPRTAERFIADVRKEIRAEIEGDLKQHRDNSFAFWTATVANKDVPLKDRMRAQENLDRLLGSHAPVKQALTDTTGNDLIPEPLSAGKAKEEARKLLDQLRAAKPEGA